MTPTVVVPLSTQSQSRLRVWRYLKKKWEDTYPWPVVIGECHDDEWSKGKAVLSGLQQVQTDLSIIIDADVWIPDIHTVLHYFEKEVSFVKPHHRFVRLTSDATKQVLSGQPLSGVGEKRDSWERVPYGQVLGGACLILRTTDALTVPIDERFKGWGGEDVAWGKALSLVIGSPRRARLTAYHLWHKPAKHLHDTPNSELKNRYKSATAKGTILSLLKEPGATSLFSSE